MILSNKTNLFTSHWVYASVLLCAVVVLPFGLARAQDYHAIGSRLKEAVANGEVTEEEAKAMMTALKESATGGAGNRDAGLDREALAQRLKAAVAAGEMTEEAAWAEWEERTGEDRDIVAWLESIGPRLRASVQAGEITKDEAWEKWEHIKENEVTPKLEAALEAGKITRGEFEEIWHGIEKSETEARLKSAVEKGEMTAKEARANWNELYGKEEMKARSDAARIEEWFFGMGDQLKAAVNAGEMSKEDAWAKWHRTKEEELAPKLEAAVEENVITDKEARSVLWHVELVEAIEHGELTKEEAEAKWNAVPRKDDE